MSLSRVSIIIIGTAISCTHFNHASRDIASIKNQSCTALTTGLLNSKVYSMESMYEVVYRKKAALAYGEIPSVNEVRLVKERPANIVRPRELSPALKDPQIEEARVLGGVFDDYKPLSDVTPRDLSRAELDQLESKAVRAAEDSGEAKNSKAYRRIFLKEFLEGKYNFEKSLSPVKKGKYPAKWSIEINDPDLHENTKNAFDYVESSWEGLIKKTPEESKGSILPLPYEFTVANATRFDEIYYWDTYFGMQGLLSTGRTDLAQRVVENFLYMIRTYGIIPNGNRDYYLSRSQPPFISSMVKEVYEATIKGGNPSHAKEWLKKRAFPLLKKDFENFWMDPKGRFDPETGLHHHWDEVNLARPERHSTDKELAEGYDDSHGLGITYRDTRAVAESGLDFTDALGKDASSTANVLLNSMMYKYMIDLSKMAKEIGLEDEAQRFAKLASDKKKAMDKYMWNEATGQFQNYSLKDQKQLEGTHAEVFSSLYSGVASKEQAAQIKEKLLLLEKDGGVMSSTFEESHHQWDGDNGWAPLHYFIIKGLSDYGYDLDATRVAKKIANTYSQIHKEEGVFLERVDVARAARPEEDGKKYPVQEGFLWTNGVFTWILTDFLKQPLKKLKPN